MSRLSTGFAVVWFLLTATLSAQGFAAASIKLSAPGNTGGSTFEFFEGGGLRGTAPSAA